MPTEPSNGARWAAAVMVGRRPAAHYRSVIPNPSTQHVRFRRPELQRRQIKLS